MEVTFIFFALNDAFGCNDKIEKCKDSNYKNLLYKLWENNDGRDQH